MPTMKDIFGDDYVSVYTRQMAINDGTLIDVTEVAKTKGIILPVAITSAAWGDCVAWDENQDDGMGQSESGRLQDVLWMAVLAMAGRLQGRTVVDPTAVTYPLNRVPRGRGETRAKLAKLKVVCGPGDDLSPVLTIMLPEED